MICMYNLELMETQEIGVHQPDLINMMRMEYGLWNDWASCYIVVFGFEELSYPFGTLLPNLLSIFVLISHNFALLGRGPFYH